MTELEQHLMTALDRLSAQYRADMLRLQEGILPLQQQVQTLAGQVQDLTKALGALDAKLTELAD